MEPKKLIAYYRVSTKKQGDSGLGLEAQETAVDSYRRSVGGIIIKAYREVESGKRADRPEITKALAHAKRAGATVVIAKLDRLSRNVAFTSRLMEMGADFVACDNPTANKLTIHILAAVAEDEARRISERTKSALAAYKARGGKLGAAREPGGVKKDGTPKLPPARLTAESGRKGSAVAATLRRQRSIESYSDLAEQIRALRMGDNQACPALSLRQVADRLNAEGHTTRRGKRWTAHLVRLVLARAAVA